MKLTETNGKNLIMRREQMVNDGLQLTLDADHWNRINPKEDPIRIPLDFTEDIEERKNAPDEANKNKKKGASTNDQISSTLP